MFETKILGSPHSPADSPEQLSALEDGALRAFDWPELVARIAATNDLRRMVRGSGSGFGGFASLAEAGPEQSLNKDERAINPKGLAAGKAPSSKAVVDDENATLGDRKQA